MPSDHLNRFARALLALAACMLLSPFASARQGEPPYSLVHPNRVAASVPQVDVAPIDAPAERADQDARARNVIGPHEKRLRIAETNPVSISSEYNGLWETLDDGSRLWRIDVRAPGATDLHLGFDRYRLPPGATLHVIAASGYYQGPYTQEDATSGDAFWAPMLPGDSATLELHIPAGAVLAPDALELADVGAGFLDLFHLEKATASTGPGTSGPCNVNVICPLGTPYGNEIRAVAYYEFQDNTPEGGGQTYICSGTLIADVPRDQTNYFLTAAHCVANSDEAASMRVYWNYRSSQCPITVGYTLADNQTGAHLRATRADVDFTLVELDRTPDPDWHVYYAGWDASNTTPDGTISIHHPSGDVAKITAGPRPLTTPNCVDEGPLNTHWQTGPYTQGTTEGGSSGSGLFVPSGAAAGARLLIGTLTGGTAMCSSTQPTDPNNGYDCYGKLAIAWDGDEAGSRLRDWLDPGATGVLMSEGIDSQAAPPPAPPPPVLAQRIAADEEVRSNRLHGIRPIPPRPFRQQPAAQ
ncbi:MAG: hypothetical protein WBV61_00035 [Rhodanobacteraceae bacterium]